LLEYRWIGARKNLAFPLLDCGKMGANQAPIQAANFYAIKAQICYELCVCNLGEAMVFIE